MFKKIFPITAASARIAVLIILFFIAGCNTVSPQTQNTAAAEINAKLALAYLEKNDATRGKAKLLQAQKQAPHEPAVWYISGYFLERTGDIASADQAYLQAIQLAPRLGAAQNNYGAFLCRQEKYTAAITHFLLAVADPDYLGVAGAYKNAALCALKIPDKSLANKYFQLAEARAGM